MTVNPGGPLNPPYNPQPPTYPAIHPYQPAYTYTSNLLSLTDDELRLRAVEAAADLSTVDELFELADRIVRFVRTGKPDA